MSLYWPLHDQGDDVDDIMAILMDACKAEEDVFRNCRDAMFPRRNL
jgi:hypothetical protein